MNIVFSSLIDLLLQLISRLNENESKTETFHCKKTINPSAAINEPKTTMYFCHRSFLNYSSFSSWQYD